VSVLAPYLSRMQVLYFLRRIILCLWPVWLYHFLPHYLIKDTIIWKNELNVKCVWIFLFFPEMFLILGRILRDIIVNVPRPSWTVDSFISIQPWRPGLAGTRAQSCDRYGSGTLHPRQVLGGSLPLFSPAFRRPHFSRQVPPSATTREILGGRERCPVVI